MSMPSAAHFLMIYITVDVYLAHFVVDC